MSNKKWHVMVTGGAGYVGSALVPKLLSAGHKVTVLDLFLYGADIFAEHRNNPNFREIKGDLRNIETVKTALDSCDAVIHLACISNDPSYDLNPNLGKSINYDAFRPLVMAAKEAGVKRFIYASSSSVYGIKDEEQVSEDLLLEPLTDYSKYKALCEKELNELGDKDFVVVTIRPSTVCGYAPRLRLDLTVNILTNHAFHNKKITVFGGTQKRPNIHIDDMVGLYLFLLQQSPDKINGKIYNAGYENYTVMEIAEMVRNTIDTDIEIDVQSTNDLRSYHVSSDKMRNELGFLPKHTIEDAVKDLVNAFKEGKVENSLQDPKYFNIKLMQDVDLK